MIHFKDHNKKSGFTFIEVVLSITIIGLILTSLFSLQGTVFNRLVREHEKISRIFFINNQFYDPEVIHTLKTKKEETIKKIPADLDLDIEVTLKPAADKSAIKKRFDNIYKMQSTGRWQVFGAQQEESIIYYMFNKPQIKKEKK